MSIKSLLPGRLGFGTTRPRLPPWVQRRRRTADAAGRHLRRLRATPKSTKEH